MKKKSTPTIIDFVTDPQLLDLSISKPQECLLRAIYGLPLPDDQMDTFYACTGRQSYSGAPFGEVTVLAGARSGKDSRIATPIAAYEACFAGHEKHLSRGEYGVIPLIAVNKEGTRIAFDYLRSYFLESPLLRSMLDGEPYANEIKLKNRITIKCFPSSQGALRGWSIPVAVFDEVGFWRLEGSANSDEEIQSSTRRGMINFPSTKLVKISSPYMKSGLLYDDYKRYYAQDDEDVLVWMASSQLMNPAIENSRLEAMRRKDPTRFEREYMAEFAEDLESFLLTAWIEAAIVQGRYELPYAQGHKYAAGCDTSGLGGGKNPDAFTMSICHQENDVIVQDYLRGWKKSRNADLNLESIVGEIAAILKEYRLNQIHGDKFAAQWPVEQFKKVGVIYNQTPEPKSFYYLATEPMFATGKIEILDNPELHRELKMLERRARAGGRTLIDHPTNRHDDLSNALAIAATFAKKNLNTMPTRLPSSVGTGTNWLGGSNYYGRSESGQSDEDAPSGSTIGATLSPTRY